MRRRLALAVCVAAGVCALAHAQPNDAPTNIAALRQQLDAARANPGGGDSADELLQRLLEAAPLDPEAPTWMLDRAELALQRAARDGAASSVMFGVPSQEQMERVSTHAAAAEELCAQARAAIDAAVTRLEERLLAPGMDEERATAIAAEVEPHLARLLEVEQAKRLPELEFAALALRALSEMPNEPRERAVRETIARVTGTGEGPTAGTLTNPRSALLAAALLVRSNDAAARESAGRFLAGLVREQDRAQQSAVEGSKATLGPIDAVRLAMGLIVCGRAEEAALVAVLGRGQDWLVDLLLAEAEARAAVRGGGDSPDARVRGAGLLLKIALRHDGPCDVLDTPQGPSAMRRLVYEKIGALLPAGAAWATIDPELALARAWMLRTNRVPNDSQPANASSAECLALLEAVGARSDAPEAVRAQAQWLLASEHERLGLRDNATARIALARLVIELPQSTLAHAAAERIVRNHAPDMRGPEPTFDSREQRGDVVAALRLLAAADAVEDRVLGAFVVALVGHPEAGARDWQEAAAACERMGASHLRERTERLVTAQLDDVLRARPPMDEHVGMLAAAAKWLEARGEAWRSLELRLQRVELIIDSGTTHDARADIEALIGSAMDRAGTVERARLRTVRGIMLRRAGDDAGAMAEFRTVAAECERDARAKGERAAAREAFWSAWAEMLEIACVGGATDAPDRIEQARQQRQRLELLDPSLGGEPWAGRIRAAAGGGQK